jgi:sulfate transport system ATP-binding protein
MPVAVTADDVRFEGLDIGLDPKGIPNGQALLFARPYDVAIVPVSDQNRLRGIVRRVHGIGPARRVELSLGGESNETILEVNAPRGQDLKVGQIVALRPEQYRLFPIGD